MKLIYTNENRFLVSNARNILENAGINVMLKNEFMAGAAGDLSPFDSWLELWVEDESYNAANKLLSVLTENSLSPDWTCSSCGEVNDASFEICWNCQNDRKS